MNLKMEPNSTGPRAKERLMVPEVNFQAQVGLFQTLVSRERLITGKLRAQKGLEMGGWGVMGEREK